MAAKKAAKGKAKAAKGKKVSKGAIDTVQREGAPLKPATGAFQHNQYVYALHVC